MRGLAARLIIPLAVASLVLAACARKQVDSPAFPDRAAQTQELTFQQIHMVTEQHGWATAPQAVWRTADGGVTWQAVTPPGVQDLTTVNWFFLDADTAWSLTSDRGRGILWHTADGGNRWDSAEVPFALGRLFFRRTGEQLAG